MQILHGLDGLRALPPGAVLSIGNFDGVHRGHQRLLDVCRARARHRSNPVAAVTFEPHPLTVLKPGFAPPRLTPPETKDALLAELGVTHLVVLPPTPEVLNVTAEQFLALLGTDVRPVHLVEGANFTFGKGRGGNIDRLREWAQAVGVGLTVIDAVEAVLLNLQAVPVSSSLIRWLIGHGRLRDAAICLGRPYALRGTVVEGFKRGRTIGVPTANLRVDDQMVPLDGVYAGRCAVGGVLYPAAVSIGTMPTFDATIRQIEGHLIGFDGDLYGQAIEVELIAWIRDQVRYKGIDALKTQIARDINATRDLIQSDPTREIARASA
jgi:riboflavin kinase / FMN adenylyltransferase